MRAAPVAIAIVRRNFFPAVAAVLFVVVMMVMRVDQFLDRSVPLDFVTGEVIPPEPHIKDKIYVAWLMTPKRQCPGTTYRRIVDASKYTHTIEAEPSLSGQIAPVDKSENLKWVGRTFDLPEKIRPGPARFISSIHFVCHPWQELWPIVVKLPEVRFTVRE